MLINIASINMKNLIQPFGEDCYESEKKYLGNQWERYFFEYTYFVKESLNPDNYIIIGRRGSGKSSLAEYFEHQKKYRKSSTIQIKSEDIFDTDSFRKISDSSNLSELFPNKLVKVWDYYIWQLIFKKLSKSKDEFKKVYHLESNKKKTIFSNIIKGLAEKHLLENTDDIFNSFENINTEEIEEFKIKAIEITQKQKLFIIIDTREQYSRNNELEMSVTSSLIQCASLINVSYRHSGIYMKVFVADEIFPYIKEGHISNNLKYIRNPLYLHWRPKDLVRLICWRFFKYLSIGNYIQINESDIDWESFDDIYEKLWKPFFGEKIINGNRIEEKTLPYILRHTHLRPRQLIIICNRIAAIAKQKKEFPKFSSATIIEGVLNSEVDLATEIVNSYNKIYPNCVDIISAIQGLPVEFKASELDRIAPRTAAQWDDNSYSPFEFSRLLVELGIVGRKKGETDKKRNIVKAEFEYSFKDRLFINENNTCIIHPMFFKKFNIDYNSSEVCVYPFPDHPDYDILKKI